MISSHCQQNTETHHPYILSNQQIKLTKETITIRTIHVHPFRNGIESVGGGVCQVATTLYNAIIRAELEITMRYNHSMIVNYVKPSSDAAIAGTYKDLRFKEFIDLGYEEFNIKIGSIPEDEPLFKIIKSRTIKLSLKVI